MDDEIQDDAELETSGDEQAVLMVGEGKGDSKLQIAARSITPFVLSALLENEELQTAFASAFHLDDMDARMGELETQLLEARQENERQASQLDLLTGELLPGGQMYSYAQDEIAQSSWSGYKGSVLNATRPQSDKRPTPAGRDIRRPRQGALASTQNSKPATKQTRREVAGELVTELWQGGAK